MAPAVPDEAWPGRRSSRRGCAVCCEESAVSDVRIRAEVPPGIGWRYTLPADGGEQVIVVAEYRGVTYLVLVDRRLDEPLTTVRLCASHASVLAALLIGARSTLDVETVEIPTGHDGGTSS